MLGFFLISHWPFLFPCIHPLPLPFASWVAFLRSSVFISCTAPPLWTGYLHSLFLPGFRSFSMVYGLNSGPFSHWSHPSRWHIPMISLPKLSPISSTDTPLHTDVQNLGFDAIGDYALLTNSSVMLTLFEWLRHDERQVFKVEKNGRRSCTSFQYVPIHQWPFEYDKPPHTGLRKETTPDQGVSQKHDVNYVLRLQLSCRYNIPRSRLGGCHHKLVTTVYSIDDCLTLLLVTHNLCTEPVVAFLFYSFPHTASSLTSSAHSALFSVVTNLTPLTHHKCINRGDGWIVDNSITTISETKHQRHRDSLDQRSPLSGGEQRCCSVQLPTCFWYVHVPHPPSNSHLSNATLD